MENSDRPQPHGIKGALQLLVLTQAAIGPIAGALETVGFQLVQAQSYRSLPDHSVYTRLLAVDWSLWALVSGLGVLAAWLLLKRWKRSTRWIVMAILFLKVFIPTFFGAFAITVFVPHHFEMSEFAPFIRQSQALLIFAIGWSIYLGRSRRVQNTYG